MSKKSIIIGTAGHIDHGKTTLIKALTGVNTDRLEEEQKRGITIELGFAPLDLDDLHIGFVDVPGHEKFVKNMLAGAGGIDAMMLIVSADESVMPQTREHVEICQLLGIKSALVAVTKSDLADPEMVELVALEVTELLEENGFNNTEIVAVSSTTGDGLEELKSKLIHLAESLESKSSDGLPRLPVDRVFTMKGFGTVVTGTLVSGILKVGDNVELIPSGKTSTIKNIQMHGNPVEEAHAGNRVAVNLPGISLDEIDRGETLTHANSMEASAVMDLHCRILPSSQCMLEHNQRIRFHLGSAELLGRVAVFGNKLIPQGSEGFLRIRLESPACGAVGDRFVIRRYSPMVTMGGGTVLDNQPLGKRESKEEIIERLNEILHNSTEGRFVTHVQRRKGITSPPDLVKEFAINISEARDTLIRITSAGKALLVSENPLQACGKDFLETVKKAVIEKLFDKHRETPLMEGFNTESLKKGLPFGSNDALYRLALEQLKTEEQVAVSGSLIRLKNHTVELDQAQQTAYDSIVTAFVEGGTAPPAPAEVIKAANHKDAKNLFELALARKILVRIAKDIFYLQEVVDSLIIRIKEKAGLEIFSVSDFKEWFGISRKYAIPVLEYLDSKGITYRERDGRKLI